MELALISGICILALAASVRGTNLARAAVRGALFLVAMAYTATVALAAQTEGGAPAHQGGEANLVLPDLNSVDFLGVTGHNLLLAGIVVCLLGLGFGLAIFLQLKNMAVHSSMREISELI